MLIYRQYIESKRRNFQIQPDKKVFAVLKSTCHNAQIKKGMAAIIFRIFLDKAIGSDTGNLGVKTLPNVLKT